MSSMAQDIFNIMLVCIIITGDNKSSYDAVALITNVFM